MRWFNRQRFRKEATMQTKTIQKHLESLLSDRNKQLAYCVSPEAKLFLEGQVMLLEQIIKNQKKDT